MWYSWCQVSVVVKLKVSVFDATDPTDHGTVIATELMQFGAIWSPSFVTIEHSQANTGLAHLATYPRWEVSGDWDRQEFPELSPGHTTVLACSPHPAEHTISTDHQWFYTKGPDRILFYGQLGVSTQVMNQVGRHRHNVGIRWHSRGRTPNVAPTLARDRRQHSLPLNSAVRI